MTQPAPTALRHADASSKSDETLRAEAAAFLVSTPAAQIVAEMLAALRMRTPSWWTPEQLRDRFPARERMRWLTERPDLRQQITSQLTGLAARASRAKTPDFQADLIDAVLESGDVSAPEFEDAFDPRDLAVYGPAEEFLQLFRFAFPWDGDDAESRSLMAWFIEAAIADRSLLVDSTRTPILTAWQVRSAISSVVWQSHLPVEIRAKIDAARLERERSDPSRPFVAADDLALVPPDVITAHLPLPELREVFEAACRSIGVSSAAAEPSRPTARNGGTASVDASPSRTAAAATPVAAAPSRTLTTAVSAGDPAGPRKRASQSRMAAVTLPSRVSTRPAAPGLRPVSPPDRTTKR